MPPLLLFLVVYSAGLIALGIWIGRRLRRRDDFFVAGRGLGTWLMFATFLAPNIGAGSTVGATDIAYREGLSAWWWNGSAGVGSLVLAFWIGPRIWRLAKDHGLLTVGDFLEFRYGPSVRGIAAAVIWIGTLYILCAQLDGIAAVLTVAGGLSHGAGSLIGAIVITGYFVAGGLASAARVNGVQLAVKLAGFALAVPLAIGAAGGWDAIAPAQTERLAFWHIGANGEGWTYLFLLGPAFFLSPGLLQKAFAARDERALTRGVAFNAVALLVFAAVPVALGLAARTMMPDLPAGSNVALPAVLARIPLAVGGLAMAAVFSAELSAADAVLFMLSTSGAQDLYKRFWNPRASEAQVLRAARVAAIMGGALGFALTFVYPSVSGALKVFYSVLVVTLFVPILGGLYGRRRNARSALTAIATGVITLAVVHGTTQGLGYFGWVTPALVGLGASSGAFAVSEALGGRVINE